MGTAISGSITVQDANLCEQVTHTSSISDTDHWALGCPITSEGNPSDSLTYSWTASDGTPATSTTANFTWTAPPCTGPVTISLTANDEPDSMDNPCPGSTRDDDPNNFNDVSTVSLPDGCSNAGPHDSSVHWTKPNDDYWSTTCTIFGDFYRPYASYDVDLKYDNCSWVCEISNLEAETRIRVRSYHSIPGKVSVIDPWDVPCDDAMLAKGDLHDTNLNDDVGAPRTKYWMYSATCQHEQKHRSDWKSFYGTELADAVSYAESQNVSIDCADSSTTTCQAARSSKIADINARFNQAYQDAYEQYDLPGTPLKEHEQRAYLVNFSIEYPISYALPEECGG